VGTGGGLRGQERQNCTRDSFFDCLRVFPGFLCKCPCLLPCVFVIARFVGVPTDVLLALRCRMSIYGSIAPPVRSGRAAASPRAAASASRGAYKEDADPLTAGSSSPRTPFVPPPFNAPPYMQVGGAQ
jgi:hypothetical protein